MADNKTIAAAQAELEARRHLLGDAVVDAAIAALGAQRTVSAPAPAAPASPARLRQISVLFADLADSTALLQRLSPEDAAELLDGTLQRFAAAVREAGGEVLRFTGDGLKAAFGTQGLREDDAERAVRAGLQILQVGESLQGLWREQHASLHDWKQGVRVGVHTGPVLLGAGHEADRTAMGQAVHLAARMEQTAPIGRLRISHETWLQVRGLFDVQAQPPLFVKGHEAPLQTWLVSGIASNPERAALRGIEGLTPPMIGRDAELAALLALVARCHAERHPALALVLAEAGVGKTRLRHELLRRLAVPTLQARAHPSQQLQAYGLVRQLLARWLSIGDELPAAVANQRFVEGLRPWLAALPEPDAAAERLGHLLGLDFGARPAVQAMRGRELREAAVTTLAALFKALAAEQGLVVVLDDVHWADDASLDLVERLAAPAPGLADTPLAWLLLGRPTLLTRRAAPQPGAGVPLLVQPLPPLGANDGGTLADALLAAVHEPPPALKALLVSRAEGNPFYMEELLRMLIDDGVVDTRARPWRVQAERLQRLRVPETLVGVLQARLDALPAHELAALQQASVIGPVFWTAALQRLDDAAPQALPALARRGTIVRHERSAFSHDEEHAFHHALLHEVTYGTVLKPMRLQGHAQAARWLSERMADRAGEFLAMTAEHFERAGDSAMALEYYDRAQTDAQRRFALGEALHLIDRALAQPALVQPSWRFQLMSVRYTSLDHLGRAAEADAALQAKADLAEALDNDVMRAAVASSRMLKADHEGRPDEARQLAHAALALAQRSGVPAAAPSATLAHGELAWLALQANDLDTAAAQIAAGLVHARVAAEVPRREGGYDAYDVQLQVLAIDCERRRHRYTACLQAADEALNAIAAKSRPLPHDRVMLLGMRSTALCRLGRLAEAAQAAAAALAIAEQLSAPRLIASAHQHAAEVALLQGETDAAQRAADALEHWAAVAAYRAMLPQLLSLRAEIARRRGGTAGAVAARQQALAEFEAQHRSSEATDLRCEWAALDLPPSGRAKVPAEALAAVNTALETAARTGLPHHGSLLAEVLLACERVLSAAGDPRAAGLLEDLGARLAQLLEQLPQTEAREQLLALPHWREAARRLAAR
jgi:class 3 adenylate cyclase